MLTPAGARALSQRGPASPPSLSRHRRPRGWGFGSRCGGEEKRRRGPGAEPLARPSSQEMRRIKGKKLEKAHQSNTERSGTREGRRGGTKRGTFPGRGALTEVAGRPSSTVISRGGRRPPQNHSDPQRKRASGGRPGLEGRRAREAVGADRRRAAASQESEALRPARPRAQLGEERPPQRSARSPGPRPRRPPRIRERRGEHRGGGSRFSQAGGRRLSGGRAGGLRGPAREGASRSLQREIGRAGRRS